MIETDMAEIILNPARAAEIVCHDEQLQVWSHEVMVTLGMLGYLREDLSHDDLIGIEQAIAGEIKSIVAMAFDHPEAQTIRRSR